MTRGRRLRKSGGGELEIDEQNIAASDEGVVEQNVVTSYQVVVEQNVIASSQPIGEQIGALLDLRLEEQNFAPSEI